MYSPASRNFHRDGLPWFWRSCKDNTGCNKEGSRENSMVDSMGDNTVDSRTEDSKEDNMD